MESKLTSSMFLVACVLVVACSPEKPRLSEDEQEYENSVNHCLRTNIEAGARWYDERFARDCRSMYLTKPQIAKRNILQLFLDKEIVPGGTDTLHYMPDGVCKTLADEYVALHEKAYHMFAGEEKTKVLATAEGLLNRVRVGLCVPSNA